MRRHSAALASAALLFAVIAIRAQTTAYEAVDADRLMAEVRALSSPDMTGRATGTEGGAKARALILERFKAIGLQDPGGGVERPFVPARGANSPPVARDQGGPSAANLAGLCRGTDPDLPFFVVSAHYDHLGIRNGVMYPGADDNASGVAALLELAHACIERPFRHSVLFVAFDAEEMGLQGARAFVASPPVPKERLALNVNLDMVARGDRNELYLAGLARYPQLKPMLADVTARPPVTLRFGHDTGNGHDDWTLQSDHGAFHAAGIPFLYFGVEDHPDYHKPTDTAEKIAPAFFAAAVGTILDVIRTLDAKPAR
jgi:Zn-dependent M28 family amino/carboxypeptidase